MKTNEKKNIETHKTGEQIVQQKLNSANQFLKKVNLDVVYKSVAIRK
jgi:hypothetical protein